MDFQEKLTRLRERIEGNLPPASVKVMHEATAALKQSGIEDRVLGVGETAPPFTLANQQGERRSLDELLARGPVVLAFYRGVWCPYCNADLQNLQRYVPELEEAGATLVAISPEKSSYGPRFPSARWLRGSSTPWSGSAAWGRIPLRARRTMCPSPASHGASRSTCARCSTSPRTTSRSRSRAPTTYRCGGSSDRGGAQVGTARPHCREPAEPGLPGTAGRRADQTAITARGRDVT